MLVFDEGCIRCNIWKIKYGKMGENTPVGHFSESSTGIIEVLPVEYRYWSFWPSSTGRIEVLPVEYRYWSFLAKFYR